VVVEEVRFEILLDSQRRRRRNRELRADMEIWTSTECADAWKTYVEESIELEAKLYNPEAESIDARLINISTDPTTNPSVWIATFGVILKIRAPPGTDHDSLRFKYVEGAFDTDGEKQALVDYLRETGCSDFSGARSMALIMPSPSVSDITDSNIDEDGEGSLNPGVLAGIVVAAVVVAVMVAIIVAAALKRRREKDDNPSQRGGISIFDEIGSVIGFRTSVDFSTLTDPMAPANDEQFAIEVGETSTVGESSVDYDFKKAQYEVKHKVFEVVAGPGNLGLAMETDSEGIIVRSINAESPLAGEVEVGDRLFYVDEIDVSDMLATQCGKLIAMRRNRPERKLVFARVKEIYR